MTRPGHGALWQVPARISNASGPGRSYNAPNAPGGAQVRSQNNAPAGFPVAAPFPQDRWIYFLADYRNRDRPAPPQKPAACALAGAGATSAPVATDVATGGHATGLAGH